MRFEHLRKTPYSLEDFGYDLPHDLIAQRPLDERTASRLMIVDRASGSLKDQVFPDIVSCFKKGDALVLNDTKVTPSRFFGRKKTGGRVEVLLLEKSPSDGEVWKALSKPALKPGQKVVLDVEPIEFDVLERLGHGVVLLDFKGVDVQNLVETKGLIPLPPYIHRTADGEDLTRYQTVYAAKTGAVAAPTAGLHFTQNILNQIRECGVYLHQITLHVGPGTFQPVYDLAAHQMHEEKFDLPNSVAESLNKIKSDGGSIWAVGTTTVRALETCVQKKKLIAGSGATNLFIAPPARFEFVDKLITNFHLPRTTLLMLVSAFGGYELIRRAYEHAIEQKYRFYSYGDAMLII